MLSMCLLFCFVIFWMLCCVMCEKKKILDDDTLYSHWSDSVMTSTTCVACLF